MEAVLTAAETVERRATRLDWWRIGDGLVLLLYSGLVLWTLQYHEKWADEAQAWLIARDLDLKTIWFHELRYEGSPGLWHTILWVAQHVFHLGYGALGYIGVGFAIAGAAVLIFCAPFPRYIRWPLAFTYVMVYQYAVIARPYTMLPLLCFLAAAFYGDARKPLRLTALLLVMVVLTMHGVVLAVAIGLAYTLRAFAMWSSLDKKTQGRYVAGVIAMAACLFFVYLIVKPTPDVEEFALKKAVAAAPLAIQAQFPTWDKKLGAVVSGAFLDWTAPSLIFVVLAGTWCVLRKKWQPFVLSVGGLIVFYVAVHGAAHHHGTVFLAAITGIWIAWPTPDESRTFGSRQKWEFRGAQLLLIVLIGMNLIDAGVAIKHEYLYPYSGGKDAADYLKSVGADKTVSFGFLFGVVAIQTYFDHNIFANNPTAYFHHGLPLITTTLNEAELNQLKPEYIAAFSNDPVTMMRDGIPELTSRGYELVHFSDGYYLYKQGVFEREVYFILKRKRDVVSVPWEDPRHEPAVMKDRVH